MGSRKKSESGSVFLLKADNSKHPIILPSSEVQNYSFVEHTNKDGSIGKKRKLTSQIENVTFEASNTTSRSVRLSESCNFAVGTISSTTQVLTLHKATPVEVRIIPFKADQATAQPESTQDQAQEKTFQTYLKARNLLSETFGTKKKRQQIRSAKNNAINIESIQNESYSIKSQIASNSNLPAEGCTEERDECGFAIHPDKPIPPYNLDAAEPRDVYDIEAVAPIELLDGLDQEVLAAKMETIVPSLALFGHDSSVNFGRLVLLNSMILFFNSISKNKIQLSTVIEQVADESIANFLFTNFSQKLSYERYEVGTQSKDRLLFYICVLFLHLRGYANVSIVELANDLKLSAHKLATYFRSLGCKISSPNAKRVGGQEDAKYATLAVPLKFPVARR